MTPRILTLSLVAVSLAGPIASTKAADEKQPVEPAKIRALPDSWDGVWRGEIEVLAGGKVQHRATMELRVVKLAAPGAKSWTIQYSGQPARDYEIRPAPGDDGHFVTDEKNGALLDEQLIGNTLHSVFSVGDVLLTSRFEIRGDELVVEIATFALPLTSDIKNARSATKTTSFAFRSIQRGVLKRQEPIK